MGSVLQAFRRVCLFRRRRKSRKWWYHLQQWWDGEEDQWEGNRPRPRFPGRTRKWPGRVDGNGSLREIPKEHRSPRQGLKNHKITLMMRELTWAFEIVPGKFINVNHDQLSPEEPDTSVGCHQNNTGRSSRFLRDSEEQSQNREWTDIHSRSSEGTTETYKIASVKEF